MQMKSFNLFGYATFAVLAVDLLATSGDITMTWASPMIPKLNSNDSSINPLPNKITKRQEALIVSFINIGAMVGGLPFGYISDKFGRKIALQIIGCLHLVAYITMTFAKCVELFYFGRLFGGISVGGGYTLLPMYIAEITEESMRGAYSVTLGIFWSFGNFIPYLVGPFVSSRSFNLVNAFFPLAFLIIFSLVGTETPYYLVGVNKMEEAKSVLMKLRACDSKGIEEELTRIKDSLDKEEKSVTCKFIFYTPSVRKAFIIVIALTLFQQMSGWNAVTSYLQTIFEASGTKLPSHISALIVGAAIFILSLPVPYVTEKFGRKTLLVFSSTVLGSSLVLLSAFFYIQTRTDISTGPIDWIPLTSLMFIVLAFQMGLACLPWTISSEVFPKNVKKLSASITSTSCWIASFLSTQFFNDMSDAFGKDGTFLFFASFAFMTAIFTITYIPETKGKTFVEIQQILQK